MNSDDLVKLQFDYAWKWFAYHADQRTKVFNFMLIVAGVLATAIVQAIDKKFFSLATGLSLLGAAVSFGFWRSDARNMELVHVGEAMLVYLERTAIFGAPEFIADRKNFLVTKGNDDFNATDKSYALGILWHQDQCSRRKPFTSRSERIKDILKRGWGGQHRIILPTIGFILVTCFLSLAVYIQCRMTGSPVS